MPKTNDNGRRMNKISQLTFMAGIVMMLTGCAALNHEPAVQEIWEMTYSDYRYKKYSIFSEYLATNYHKKYVGFTRLVTIERDGDRIAIKGMFPEYPDVWIKGRVKEHHSEGDMDNGLYVFLEKSKVMGVVNGKPVYFHNGRAICEAVEDGSSSTLQVSFDMNNGPEKWDFYIIDPDNKYDIDRSREDNAFWLSNDKDSTCKFYTSWQNGRVVGTGFPKMDNYIVDVRFRRVSTGNGGTGEADTN